MRTEGGATAAAAGQASAHAKPRADWKAAACYLATALLSLGLAAGAMQLWRADLHVPLQTSSDAAFYEATIKNLVEHGAVNTNVSLGAPWTADFHDFPLPHTWHFFLLKLLALFTSDPAVLMNGYYLLTFFLCALSALAVLRQLGVSRPLAMAGSVVYTLLPYHFLRGEVHLFLASYYLVPLVLLVTLWVASGEPLFRRKGWVTRRGLASLVICALVACDNPYYAFFGSFFLVVAGAVVYFRQRRLRVLAAPALLVATILVVLLLNLAPNLLYFHQHGRNEIAAQRHAYESELYGLKIVQLVLPVTGHRVSRLADVKERYNRQPSAVFRPWVNENDCSSLGLIGSVGLAFLMGWLLFAAGQREEQRLITDLGVLAVSGVLLGTIGGFGTLFALLVSPQMRAYNRISIFLGFLAVVTAVVLLEWLTGTRKPAKWAIAILLVGVAFFDQTTPGFVPDYKSEAREYASDQEFVQRIENLLPQHAMVFQLPYVPFPGTPPVNRMAEYDHLRGYLHSRELRWSFAAVKGRDGDAWLRMVTAQPLPEMVQTLAFAGFQGIYLDRFGYAENSTEASLGALLETGPIVSDNGRLVFFDLRPYTQRLRSRYKPEQWQASANTALHPLLVEWRGGFFKPESSDGHTWRWCEGEGDSHISNTSNSSRQARVEMGLSAAPGRAPHLPHLLIEAPAWTQQVQLDDNNQVTSAPVSIPPGHYIIRLRPDRKTGDRRFRVNDFRLIELAGD